ncbi:Uma2 family endonuclease [Schinkia azotoformans]|uniref:Uma2 family endonuclease n=1 Tax=Schinkia azotoformans TaxID=1454 RepID=UPI002DB9C419|nr:Uma2 family endonuclease [Schinkia azotoformans]MEC1715123.1 Uma2 family endonuclease [Schinkia azotoformans]MEC1739827.1 Uma2 family endonuclease [Schinkia azotoformans]MEC1745548.1 Uma2 family endonuclease [Schinkia azotoformans]MEC1760070.1 Uma2 family endonuclease [Schinkia azotoformans]MEC1765048.1 Uma2 family endonuclease [Schinkia azotoformans]
MKQNKDFLKYAVEQNNAVKTNSFLTIVCNPSKLDERECKGSPDMVIETTSPSTARKDKVGKLNKYEQARVKEYWFVEPAEKIVNVFTLQENQRFGRPDMYIEEEQVKVAIFDDLMIDLHLAFR